MKPSQREIPKALLAQIADQCSRPVPSVFAPLSTAMHQRFGAALQAVILYGSCLRDVPVDEGVVDLYALVSDYRAAYPGRMLRLLNRLLPPNVFYLEVESEDRCLRVKYAVISMREFSRGVSCWFHPYLWARFAQPVRLTNAANEAVRATVQEALARAVLTFLENVIPVIGSGEFPGESIWRTGLSLSYAAELRPERESQPGVLAQRDAEDYARLIAAALPALAALAEPLAAGRLRYAGDAERSRRLRRTWALRRLQGRVLSVFRLIKAVFTFSGGLDYAAWKIERHSGIRIEVTPALRRRPILGGLAILWKLIRSGALR